jgi:hypothetical protein
MIEGIAETENIDELNCTNHLSPNEEIENYIKTVPIIDETEEKNNASDDEPPSPIPLCPQYSPSLVSMTQKSYDKMEMKYQTYSFARSGYYYYFLLYHSEDDNIYEVCKNKFSKSISYVKKVNLESYKQYIH